MTAPTTLDVAVMNLPGANAPPQKLGPRTWLDYRHPEYARCADRWRFAIDFYTGDVLNALDRYLVKRFQGETLEAYQERQRLADYSNHMGVVVDSLAGMVMAVEDDANRVYFTDDSEGLGDPADPESAIAKLQVNADGQGASLETLMKQAAADFSVTHKVWCLVDSPDGDPVVRLLPPTAVVNWREDGDTLVEVMLQECADTRTSIKQDPAEEERFVLYDVNGWERFKADDKGNVVSVNKAEKGYVYETRAGKRTVPIFYVEVPLRRMVGWLLAKKASAIFNQESGRDNLLRNANFPKLNIHANDDLFETIVDNLKKGSNVLQAAPDGTAHSYIAPDTGPATVATEVLKRKVEEFYVTAFREYGDAAQEKTATEVKQDVAAGAGAYLQLLSAALDNLENGIYWLAAQTLYPGKRERWGVARVTRSRDFAPADAAAELIARRDRYFGKDVVIPVGKQALLSCAREMAEFDGLNVDDKELEAAVDAFMLDAIASDEGAPAELKVRALMQKIAASGTIDPEQVVDLTDGEKTTLVAQIEKQARENAEAKQTELRNQALMVPGALA